MATLRDKGTLTGLFSDKTPDYRILAYQQGEANRIEDAKTHLGQLSGSNAGKISQGGIAAKSKAEDEREKRKLERENDRIRQLLDDIAAIDRDIDNIQTQITDVTQEISNVSAIQQALTDGLMEIEDALEETDVQDAIKAWENKTGKKFNKDDDNAPEVLAVILGTHLDTLNEKLEGLRGELKDKVEQREQLQNELRGMANEKGIDFEKTTDISQVTESEVFRNEAVNAHNDEMQITSEIIEQESDEISAFMHSISSFIDNETAYNSAIDKFIEEIGSGDAKILLLNEISSDETRSVDLRVRAAIHQFKMDHEYVAEEKGTVDYPDIVDALLYNIPEELRDDVRSSNEFISVTGIQSDLPNDVASALQGEFKQKSIGDSSPDEKQIEMATNATQESKLTNSVTATI